MNWVDWAIIAVYTMIGAGLFYIIWVLGKEANRDDQE